MSCRVCLVPHNPAIHRATESVHRWLRADVERRLVPVKIGKQGKGGCWAKKPVVTRYVQGMRTLA